MREWGTKGERPLRQAIALHDQYTHGTMPRRDFLARLARLAGGAAAASVLLPLLESQYAVAATVATDDPALLIGRESFESSRVGISAYVARPKAGAGRLPAVIVIHGNRGLNAHIEDVARRFALAGFLAMAPDALSGKGGTPANEDEARKLISELDPAWALQHLRGRRALREAASARHRQGRLRRFLLGRRHGRPARREFGGAQCRRRLLRHAARSGRSGARYELHSYADADHAFNNDTNTARHNADAAKLAWQRTVDFLTKELA